MGAEELFSVLVSQALDVLGLNRRAVEIQRRSYDHLSERRTENLRSEDGINSYVTVTGSKRGGLAGSADRDTDYMTTFNEIICTDDPESVTDDMMFIFELNRKGCPEGYTKLPLFDKDKKATGSYIENCVVDSMDGNKYLSSKRFINVVHSVCRGKEPIDDICYRSVLPITGPSVPSKVYEPFFGQSLQMDNVVAFHCKCTEYLQSWISRPRCHDWPSASQIETAEILGAHVVPVGAKGFEDEHLQWRICFTLTEVDLMQSLNETQWKVYALLKMMMEELFKTLYDNLLTSYVLKNAVMWICEQHPMSEFHLQNLGTKTRQCIEFLITGFQKRNLPNYMISKRNLLGGKLNNENRKEHIEILLKIKENLPISILKVRQIANAIIDIVFDPDGVYANMIKNTVGEITLLKVHMQSSKNLFEFVKRVSAYALRGHCNLVEQILLDNIEVFGDELLLFSLAERFLTVSKPDLQSTEEFAFLPKRKCKNIQYSPGRFQHTRPEKLKHKQVAAISKVRRKRKRKQKKACIQAIEEGLAYIQHQVRLLGISMSPHPLKLPVDDPVTS